MSKQYPLSIACEVLVSASGYFAWVRHHKTPSTALPGRYSNEALPLTGLAPILRTV
jgi:hypothetical protein